MKFQGDILNFCDFIQVNVFTSNHHLNVMLEFYLKQDFGNSFHYCILANMIDKFLIIPRQPYVFLTSK